MKKLVITILFIYFGLPILAQEEFHFPPAVIAAGGNADGNSTHLSRWRLSMIHVITLPGDYSIENRSLIGNNSEVDWTISLYPNPVEKHLYLEFQIKEARDFMIKLIDVTGQVLVVQEARTMNPSEIIELDISRLSPALYLLHISTPNLKTRKIYRVQKI